MLNHKRRLWLWLLMVALSLAAWEIDLTQEEPWLQLLALAMRTCALLGAGTLLGYSLGYLKAQREFIKRESDRIDAKLQRHFMEAQRKQPGGIVIDITHRTSDN